MAYDDSARAVHTEHSLILTNRESLKISGVVEVKGFDEDTVILTTTMGELTILGGGLHVERIDLDTGELSVSGHISELGYADTQTAETLWRRLFG